MLMRQVTGRPPNYDEILKVFPAAANDGVIFAYGETIYVPSGEPLTPALLEHEGVHGRRQIARGVGAWWDEYLRDPEFRFAEELPAHRVEYKAFCEYFSDRNLRAEYLQHIAKRLSSELYGNVVTLREARRAIQNLR